jgi:hypothetical protein
VRAVGARPVTVVALLAGVAVLLWYAGLTRADYWAQLDPWVPFVAAAFAMLCGTLMFAFWRLDERSEYYFRFGERQPWGNEIVLLGWRDRVLAVGHAAQVEVIDFPPVVLRVGYIAAVLGLALVAIDNRAVALLRDTPKAFARPGFELCPEPKPPEPPAANQQQGCKLVLRAYQLGYTKSLGTCGPQQREAAREEVCRKRQRDEPLLHYQWRLFETRSTALVEGGSGPGVFDRLGTQLDHLDALFDATVDSVAMRPRSSHHLFTNLPDPRPSFRDRLDATLERRCGARLAQAPHVLEVADTPAGRSSMLEHVVDQLVFNPIYKPVVAQCGELVIHWAAPLDTCDRIVAQPRQALADRGALAAVVDVLAWRARKGELADLKMRELGPPPPPERVASLQCIMFGDTDSAVTDRTIALDGAQLHVRQLRARLRDTSGASQVHLYKRLAELLAEGFSYGHLTSNESVGASRESTAIAKGTPGAQRFVLSDLELLRDADLLLGNDWLTQRPDLLEVYPYHLHLKNFVEIFRTQYKLHRGRL